MACSIHTSKTETPQTNPLSCDPNKSQVDYLVNNYMNLCRHSFPDLVSCTPVSQNQPKTIYARTAVDRDEDADDLWRTMNGEAKSDVDEEPILSNYYFCLILSHDSLCGALANHLSTRLSYSSLPSDALYDLFLGLLTEDQEIMRAVKDDLRAVKDRGPACTSYVHCFLNYKGFIACQAHRVAHKLWSQGRKPLALLIQNRVSEVFAVDIHPGAKIGRGILIDHATGVVIGKTAVIGNNVSIFHDVTLGGNGKASGDRHPKIGDGVLIDGAKIGAGSVVLREVPPRTTGVGIPARLVGGKENPIRLGALPTCHK